MYVAGRFKLSNDELSLAETDGEADVEEGASWLSGTRRVMSTRQDSKRM